LANAGGYSVRATNSTGCAMNYSAVLSVVSTLTNSPNSVLAPTNMVNWWATEGNANDIFGATNATPQNGIYYTNGEVGSAIHFDGATGFMKTGAPGLAPPWTVCMWIYRQNALNTAATLMSDTSTNVLRLEQYNNTREVGITVQGVNDYTFPSAYSVPQNTWTHLTFVDNGSQVQLYTNGVSNSALSLNFPLPRAYFGMDSFSEPDAIGSKTYRLFADRILGSLDEIQVFNRALSASEIAAIYNAGSAGLVRAPQFTSVAFTNSGQIQLNLRGQTGKTFTLYASTNLLLNWTLLGTIPNPIGATNYTDSTASSPQKFYRVSQP
jgi:hypothetical protein